MDVCEGVIPLTDNERCVHELIRQQCGYCRVPPPPAFMEAAFDVPNDGEDGDEFEVVSTLAAKEGGHCAKCDRFYGQREPVFLTVTGVLVCSECAL